MFEIPGQYSTARVYANVGIEQGAYAQIQAFVNHAAFIGSNISIMPDVHEGKGAVIGFTATLPPEGKIIPNIVGVDVGCTVMAYPLFINLKTFLKKVAILNGFIIGSIPSGMTVRESSYPRKNLAVITKKYFSNRFYSWYDDVERVVKLTNQDMAYVAKSIGTLGGGNHFIEVDVDEEDMVWLIIHSGSRNFGLKVANFFQRLAYKTLTSVDVSGKIAEIKATKKGKDIEEAIKALKRAAILSVPRDLAYLEGANAKQYLDCMQVAQDFAAVNCRVMAAEILPLFDLKFEEDCVIESTHNYIDLDQKIIRKGAIAANKGQPVLIPLTMKAGIILGVGKGNPDWNFSAPHGAGRKLSRKKAKNTIKLADYKKEMEDSGVWTTSVSKATLDEAPGAYKDPQEIIDAIGDSVEISQIMRPVYNYKDSPEEK